MTQGKLYFIIKESGWKSHLSSISTIRKYKDNVHVGFSPSLASSVFCSCFLLLLPLSR